jgi:hypothetical protein
MKRSHNSSISNASSVESSLHLKYSIALTHVCTEHSITLTHVCTKHSITLTHVCTNLTRIQEPPQKSGLQKSDTKVVYCGPKCISRRTEVEIKTDGFPPSLQASSGRLHHITSPLNILLWRHFQFIVPGRARISAIDQMLNKRLTSGEAVCPSQGVVKLSSKVTGPGLATALRAGRSGDRIPLGSEIFCTCPDRTWGPPCVLRNRDEAWCWPPTPSSADVKERVVLYRFFPTGPSSPLLGWNFTFTLQL